MTFDLKHPIFQEYIENPVLNGESSKAQYFLPHALVLETTLWETSEVDLIFLEDLPFSEEELDEAGYYFYDENLFPMEVGQLFLGLFFRPHAALWPFFEVELTDSPIVPFRFDAYLTWFIQRRRRAWLHCFKTMKHFILWFLLTNITFYFIFLTTVGIGYSCELIQNNKLRLILSNTHDFVVSVPPLLHVGCLAPSGESADSTIFFFFSADYLLLRQYAQFVRTLVRFNRYEYRGLLYWQEQQVKKLTKQKQR